MAYDEHLAERLRELLAHRVDVDERHMFGGLSFMLAGNLCCGVMGDGVIVRVGAERAAELVSEPGARVFDFTGRPMRNWLYVEAPAIAEDDDLARWVGVAEEFASGLPPK